MKTKSITFKLDEKELKQIRENAWKAKKRVSEYLRDLALKKAS